MAACTLGLAAVGHVAWRGLGAKCARRELGAGDLALGLHYHKSRVPDTPISVLPVAQLLLLFPLTFGLSRKLIR